MSKRSQAAASNQPPLRLRASLEDAKGRIAVRIAKGHEIQATEIRSWEELKAVQKEYWKWSSYNEQLLKQLFTTDELADEYSRLPGIFFVGGDRDLGREIAEFQDDVGSKLHRLESISERLELIPLSEEIAKRLDAPMHIAAPSTTRIFVVHGHDTAAREAVARFLERLGLEPIVLHEQANEGMTVIEKLEQYSDVAFVVVLLTPDDEGRATGAAEPLKPRARQNVVLELGYFTGRLGRRRVCALHRGSLELPSDYLGVLYLPLDEGGGWQLKLAKELKAAGFSVDMNRAV